MNKAIILILFALMSLAGCTEKKEANVYRNRDFGYLIAYPSDYQASELKWVKDSIGTVLQGKKGTITVKTMPAGNDYGKLSFDQYVRTAAAGEIQNCSGLVSIESFVSDFGVKGYKTRWEVIINEDAESGEIKDVKTVGPIYFFPPRRKQKLGDRRVMAIMIEGAPEEDARKIAASFRYVNSLKTFFRKGHYGKKFTVEKGKPFRVELEANPTTGYNWYITEMDENYFKISRSGYVPLAGGRVGAGGTSYWEINPIRSGKSEIRLQYYRAWEGKESAVDEFKIRTVIR